jgi:hypothetical protein
MGNLDLCVVSRLAPDSILISVELDDFVRIVGAYRQ